MLIVLWGLSAYDTHCDDESVSSMEGVKPKHIPVKVKEATGKR